MLSFFFFFFFFFQAEDGIRDLTVTGVQTCALPICARDDVLVAAALGLFLSDDALLELPVDERVILRQLLRLTIAHRSEEHTSELQSQSNLVCRLLLEKKKKKKKQLIHNHYRPATNI